MGDLSFISNLHVSIFYFFLIVAACNVLLDFWLTQHQDKSHVWENLLGNKPVSDSDLFSTFCDELRIYLPFCPSIVKPSNVCEGIVLHINNQTSSCKERGNRQPLEISLSHTGYQVSAAATWPVWTGHSSYYLSTTRTASLMM